jgi:hypothetical protein
MNYWTRQFPICVIVGFALVMFLYAGLTHSM